MIVGLILVIFVAFSYIRPLLLEMERRDALLLNATLSSNKTQFLSEEWLREGGLPTVLVNATEEGAGGAGGGVEGGGSKGAKVPVEPDWTLVLGTFKHTRDEGLEEFLIAAGLSFFTRSIILNTSPTITFDRAFQGDDFYYYDLPSDDHADVKYDEGAEAGGGGKGDAGGGEEGGRAFQMILTTSSWVTLKQNFRIGHPFTKDDYDGTPSRNTYVFKSPTALFHYKEKERGNTTIVHTFDQEGLITTIISGTTGIQARRHFRRQGV
ncbi:uncharacterized protein LOC127004063 [Eriocheir sinensis]|uniref:uncharacterized protein LOC127004063 n=1 Tax=Eriocheir sinensis TaxID=95602 RepID=UPI0021C8C872|nr:uncharacterized protein LOC127004063 [Eriocheir sinensis]